MSDSWRDLLARAQTGDRDAADRLLARHLDALRAHVRRSMGRALRAREASADLVQSVCREVLGDLRDFEPRHETGFRHWLFRRAERKIGGRFRFWQRLRRAPERDRPLDDADAGAAPRATPSRVAAAREELERLERAFARLEPEEREIIRLARLLGLSHREIAARLSIGEAASWSRLHRALARLTSLLDQ